MHAQIVSLENIQLQMERQCARLVLRARTQRQQGPVTARIASPENIKLQVERQRARLVLPIRLRQSRAQQLCLVLVALVLRATRRAPIRVRAICSGRAVADAVLHHQVSRRAGPLASRSMETVKLGPRRITQILGGCSISQTPKRSRR